MERDEPKVIENELFKVYDATGKQWDEFLIQFRSDTNKQIKAITKVNYFNYDIKNHTVIIQRIGDCIPG
jgi:hypothetical protein